MSTPPPNNSNNNKSNEVFAIWPFPKINKDDKRSIDLFKGLLYTKLCQICGWRKFPPYNIKEKDKNLFEFEMLFNNKNQGQNGQQNQQNNNNFQLGAFYVKIQQRKRGPQNVFQRLAGNFSSFLGDPQLGFSFYSKINPSNFQECFKWVQSHKSELFHDNQLDFSFIKTTNQNQNQKSKTNNQFIKSHLSTILFLCAIFDHQNGSKVHYINLSNNQLDASCIKVLEPLDERIHFLNLETINLSNNNFPSYQTKRNDLSFHNADSLPDFYPEFFSHTKEKIYPYYVPPFKNIKLDFYGIEPKPGEIIPIFINEEPPEMLVDSDNLSMETAPSITVNIDTDDFPITTFIHHLIDSYSSNINEIEHFYAPNSVFSVTADPCSENNPLSYYTQFSRDLLNEKYQPIHRDNILSSQKQLFGEGVLFKPTLISNVQIFPNLYGVVLHGIFTCKLFGDDIIIGFDRSLICQIVIEKDNKRVLITNDHLYFHDPRQ